MAQVLRDQLGQDDPNLLVGADLFDDAGVYRIGSDTALVQTVDFFPPLVDDPFTFGQVAAANAMSDIYAMGAKPLTALNIVGFPDKELPYEVLIEILRGGLDRAKLAGVAVVGGHSVRDAEVKYGMAVTGLIHPDRIVTNAQARAGDVLVLTKPIGSGILTSAAKSGKISEVELRETIDVMTELNAGACEAMLAAGAASATDVTGFGLVGHAFEIARASDVSIHIEAATVPLLAETLELARKGIVTRAYKSNLEWAGGAFRSDGVDDTLVKVLADAQTSGGLLICIPKDRLDGLLTALADRKTKCAAVIGEVRSPTDGLRVTLH